jgi:predicted ATPase
LKILATSREPLHIHGEREVLIPPLPHQAHASHDITPAMALFEERAREVRPDFAIDDENRAAISELCRRLDALPLAIELAAARTRVMSPQAMVLRLQKSLSLLSGGKRDSPERHHTLRATLDWSLDLLRPEERVFFRRLGIFAGSFSEDAAAAVVFEMRGAARCHRASEACGPAPWRSAARWNASLSRFTIDRYTVYVPLA